MEWIKCSERLPHAECGESENALTVSGAGVVRVLCFDGACWCYPNGNLYEVEPESYNEQRITHWMPLPEPPQE
ncbi:MAG: hypothetical protein DBX91_14110 [Subdoligranulum variabile]|uniref:DUF551 domain-containing protein n=1 Tax=Gemmiger formicilis TaxID=745368 RepID=UPI000D7AE568|nr:MAG: hypothetical protein DBX91_14110 [Subdoligranulum variabile]